MGRPKEAAAIRNRRRELELTIADVVDLTGGTVNQKFLSRLENGHADPKAMRNDKYRALAAALSWTEDEFQAAIEGRPAPVPAPSAEAQPVAPPPDARPATSPGAERFRLLRERSGLSLCDVAARTQGAISHGTVRLLETRGDEALDGVSLGTLRALARAYGLTVTDLVRFVTDDAPLPVPAHFSQLALRDETERLARSAVVDLRYQARQLERRLQQLEEQLDELLQE